MKKYFSKHWKSSSQPRKQRKYTANAPIHIKRKMLSINLSKDLRKKYSVRNVSARKGDLVKIMRGKFKKKQGKITDINIKFGRIYIDGILAKKRDGSSVQVPVKSSNLQILELNLENKRRIGKKEEKITEKKENKSSKNIPNKKNFQKSERNSLGFSASQLNSAEKNKEDKK